MSGDYETQRRKENEKVLWVAAIILVIIATGIYIGLKHHVEESSPFFNPQSTVEED